MENKFTQLLKGLVLSLALIFNYTTTLAECPPYLIPEIKTEADFANVVYVDPSVGSGGNGSISSPLSVLPATLAQNTAYLIKRGTTHPYISRVFNNVLLGAYGQGAMPVINGGMEVRNNSHNSTIRDLDIARQRTGNWDKVLEFNHQNVSTNITVAYCKIRGIASGGIYPQYAIHHAVDGLVMFNNEIFNIDNNGWWLTPHSDVKVIRNWIHNVNKGGENSTSSSGDGIQAEYGLTGFYFAGNILDKSNSMWKYGLMLNGQQHYNVVEYNTFYPPKTGAGGAGVRWMAQQGGIFRKNLVRAIGHSGNQLVVPFDTWDSHANKSEPYGIRDNHIVTVSGAGVSTNGVTLHPSNMHIIGLQAYQSYLDNNPSIGQYGSDITAENFWLPACSDDPEPQKYTVTFQVSCYHEGGQINDATITFNGVTLPAGQYTFSNVPEGTYNYNVAAPMHNPSANSAQITQNTTIPVALSADYYDIEIIASPQQGGTFAGQGSYQNGQTATVVALANEGYNFINWTSNGNIVSTNSTYSFTVTGHSILYANFEAQAPQTYSLQYISSGNGIIMGDSNQTVQQGESGSPVRAVPMLGYNFTRWSDGSVQNPRTDINVTSNITVYAQFSMNTSSISQDMGQYIRIYPNPVTDIMNVGISTNKVFTVVIVNSHGQIVAKLDPASQGNNQYSLGNLTPGVYFIHLSSSNVTVSRSFIKQ